MYIVYVEMILVQKIESRDLKPNGNEGEFILTSRALFCPTKPAATSIGVPFSSSPRPLMWLWAAIRCVFTVLLTSSIFILSICFKTLFQLLASNSFSSVVYRCLNCLFNKLQINAAEFVVMKNTSRVVLTFRLRGAFASSVDIRTEVQITMNSKPKQC